MKKNKYALSMGLVVLASTALTGCRMGQQDIDRTKTNIQISMFQGTAGTDWLKNAAKRFTDSKATTSYEDGKKGVEIIISQQESPANDAKILEDGKDIYIDENRSKIYQNAASGYLLDLNDVVSPLASKIDTDCLKSLKGPNGHYYALPHYEWFPNVTYNIDLLESKNLYFAYNEVGSQPANAATAKFCGGSDKLDQFRFVINKTAQRSVGPDGVKGTADDGLPSTLQEFCVWCAQAKQKAVNPFIIAGKASVYSFYLTNAIWSSLAGAEKMKNIYCNYTDAAVDVVKKDAGGNYLYSDNDLFYEGSGIKAPQIETVTKLDDTNGYLMYDMVERYYSIAFLELMTKEGWLNKTANDNEQYTAFNAQDEFINGPDVGVNEDNSAILYDASYWYHEAADLGYVKKYEDANDNKKPNVAVMPMPTALAGHVAEVVDPSDAHKQTLLNIGSTHLYASKKVAENPGKERAVKDFISFLYTDNELKAFSELLGLTVPMTYTYAIDNLDPYYAKLATLKQGSNIIQFASDTPRFNKNLSQFSLYYNSALNNVIIDGVDYHGVGYRDIILKKKKTSRQIFEAGCLSQTTWNSLSV